MAENETSDAAGDVEAPKSWLLALSRDFGRTVRLGKDGIELLADAACGAANTTRTITKKIVKLPKPFCRRSPDENALLEKLGSRIADCPGGDYLSLKDDAEFWELVKELHSIRGKGDETAVAEEEPQQEETVDAVPEDSGAAEAAPEQEDAPDDATPEQPKTGNPSAKKKAKPRKRESSPRSPRQEEGGRE
ncbi:hypothetical protein ACFL5Q_02385 [Planctomycetota bacterium]